MTSDMSEGLISDRVRVPERGSFEELAAKSEQERFRRESGRTRRRLGVFREYSGRRFFWVRSEFDSLNLGH